MINQTLSRRQAFSIIIMYNFGSSVVMGVSAHADQDAWLSLVFAVIYVIPVVLMYSRIMELNPQADLFSVIESLLGKVIGKIAIALMTWYAIHLCALVMRNFSEFLQISSMPETPQLPVLIIMLLVVSYLAKSGGKALGKWALATMPVVLGVVVITILLSLNIMNFDNFLPIIEHKVGTIAVDALQVFSFPFAETVLFLGIADCICRQDSPRRIYIGATLFSAIVLMLIILRNLSVLGAAVMSVEYFPSYAAARIINMGDFLSRIEGSISVNFSLAGITKVALCLIVASKGMAKLFGMNNHQRLVLPVGLIALALATILYQSTMQMFGFIKYYQIYATPFQIIIPATVWIISEIRARRGALAGQRAA